MRAIFSVLKTDNVTEIYPFFESHARKTYPHLDCLEDLREISNLSEPANWYIEARELKRKIVYHAGPTNSGKTYSALQDFMSSSSGIYCGPLKLLANEVFTKANQTSARCDLVTGEERRFATGDESQPAEHIACTVEMANLDKDYECAVIDEIQMIGDAQRGWAWTRALLGLKAKTIHICGDRSALDLIKRLSKVTGDDLEVRTYERLTPLSIMDKAVENFDRVEPGDCIVCFNKQDIFSVVSELEKRGHEVAVIYGSMPPQVKLSQAARFNDPNDKCKLLVATDAVGMGLNLNIRRVVFYSLKKPQIVERTPNPASSLLPAGLVQSSTDITHITTSQALQIAGRAGRFNTHFKDGFVSTFNKSDLPTLKEILKRPLEKTDKAGLHPTPEQIELFGFYLPNYSLSDLIRVFASLCSIDERQYFLSAFDDVAYLASLIDHIPLKLKAKYTFATSPIGEKQTFACTCFVKFVRFYSNNEAVSADTLRKMLGCWPLRVPANLGDVAHLECVYDVLDLYLWLAYRFPEIFVDRERCRLMRDELENVIYKGVKNISFLNQNQGPDEEAPSSLKTKFR